MSYIHKISRFVHIFVLCFALVMALADLEEQKKPQLFPIKTSTVCGMLLTAFGIMVAAGSGIGGGGILVPLYILVMGISPLYAIPLSNVTILGGSLANTALYLNRRHPQKDRPLIDFDFAVVMEPPTMSGAMIGAIVNKNTPVWLITMLLVLVLLTLTYRTFWQGFKRYNQETLQMQASQAADDPIDGEKGAEESNPVGADTKAEAEAEEDPLLKNDPETDKPETPKSTNQELTELLEEERHIPWLYIAILPSMFSVVLVTLLANQLAGISCGSAVYWTLEILPIAFALSVFSILSYRTISLHKRKVTLNYPFTEGDILWTPQMTALAGVICSIAGLFAGLFGVGGGLIKGPQMIEMGMLPEVAAATTAFMIIFTSASATVSYGALGLMAWDYALPLFLIGVIFTLVGQIGFEKVSTLWNKRSSFTVFLIAIVLGISTVLLGYISIRQTIISFQSSDPNAIKGTCG